MPRPWSKRGPSPEPLAVPTAPKPTGSCLLLLSCSEPPRAVCRGRLAHKLSGLKKKRRKKQSWLNFNPLFVCFLSLLWLFWETRRSVRSRWFLSSAPRALLAMLFPSSLGNALFPPAATLLKDKLYPKVLLAVTPHWCIYTFATFSGPRRWERFGSQRRRRA